MKNGTDVCLKLENCSCSFKVGDVELRVTEMDCTPSHIFPWKANKNAAEFCLSGLRTDLRSIVTQLIREVQHLK
jgi:predicted nucleic acid-binding Zn finger protein